MKKKIAIIRPQIRAWNIWEAVFPDWAKTTEEFSRFMAGDIGKNFVYLADSGLSCFYMALKALQADPQRNQVILPAYTAGSLVAAIRKAGLTPVLCDISLKDFNIDREALYGLITERTLAVVAVHMFGIPMDESASFRMKVPERVTIIEDCCQSEGARVEKQLVGNFGEISVFSFNRGKNFSLLGGGCVCVDNEELARKISKMVSVAPRSGAFDEFLFGLESFFSVLALNPNIYGLVSSKLDRFRETAPPSDFTVGKILGFQCGLWKVLNDERESMFRARHENGEFVRTELTGCQGLRLPEFSADCYPVYNRFPLLFDDVKMLLQKQKELLKIGYESSRMYLKPLHQMFQLDYAKDAFPNATYLAEHLLTLPVYPALGRREIWPIIQVLRR